MEGNSTSKTAEAAALMRAAHLLIDGEPKILEDRFALLLIGQAYESIIRETRDALGSPELARLRSFIVLRSRYAEEELQQAIHRNITQYVILGAGLDSFAYRRQDISDLVRVFELDHPATQQWKRTRLAELGEPLPRNLAFIPMDFEKQSLKEAMDASACDRTKPVFFSWLGVTQYLTHEAVFRTLQYVVSESSPGSQIVFQYCVPESLLDNEDKKLHGFASRFGSNHGEPWLSYFDPGELSETLRGMGFEHVEDFGPDKAFERYFRGRTDGLRPPGSHRLMKATVGARS